VVSFTPRQLYPQRKNPWYPLDKRLGGSQSQSGNGGEENISQSMPRLEPLLIQPAAQRCTNELTRLLIQLLSLNITTVLCVNIFLMPFATLIISFEIQHFTDGGRH
jgi:hypothetical protein